MRPFASCLPWHPAARLALLLLPFAAAVPAPAQERGPVVRGIVTDSAGAPLEAAELELVGARKKATTGADGRFSFTDLRPGRYWVLARMVGYRPFQASLSLRGEEERELAIALTRAPVELPEVVVRAENSKYQQRMRDFVWRSRASFRGRFLTRDDIDRARPARLGDLVIRHLPYKAFFTMNEPGGYPWDGFGAAQDFSTARLSRRTTYHRTCPPAVAVNGSSITPGFAVNDFHPDDVEALEVYREGASLPIEYSWNHRARCGLVVVWLKSYAHAGA